jgi:hypothetical protein
MALGNVFPNDRIKEGGEIVLGQTSCCYSLWILSIVLNKKVLILFNTMDRMNKISTFPHHSSLFYHFRGVYSSLFYQKQGCYSSLFYQKVVSLHADVLYFFSNLNEIIELCIYNER